MRFDLNFNKEELIILFNALAYYREKLVEKGTYNYVKIGEMLGRIEDFTREE